MIRHIHAAALLLSFLVALPQAVAQSGPPIRIGMTLALTGPIAAPGAIQKAANAKFADALNTLEGLPPLNSNPLPAQVLAAYHVKGTASGLPVTADQLAPIRSPDGQG